MKIKRRIFSFILTLVIMIGTIGSVPAIVAKAEIVPENGSPNIIWDKSCSGTVSAKAVHRFYFTLQSSGKVSFTGTTSNTSTRYPTKFVLYNDAGEVIRKIRVGDQITALSAELLAGKYYFEIDNYGNDDSHRDRDYNFIPSFIPSNETKSENYLTDNNSAGSATPYTLGTNYVGHLANNDDKDVYVFKVSKPGTITITMSSSVLRGYSFELINTSGSIKHSKNDLGVGRKISDPYFLPSGKYYLTVNRKNTDDGYVGNYSFVIKYSAIPKTLVKKAVNSSKKTVTVKWKKSKKADGYRVGIYKTKACKKAVKIKNIEGNNKNSCKFSKLKKGTYYVRIKTIVKDNNGKPYYSDWSKVIKVKVKK